MTKNPPIIRETCPRCGGKHTYRNGYNKLAGGKIRWRWRCHDCARGFNESNKNAIAKLPKRSH